MSNEIVIPPEVTVEGYEMELRKQTFDGLKPLMTGFVPIINIREPGRMGRFQYIGSRPDETYPKVNRIRAVYLGGNFETLGSQRKDIPPAPAIPGNEYEFPDTYQIQQGLMGYREGDVFGLECVRRDIQKKTGFKIWIFRFYSGLASALSGPAEELPDAEFEEPAR